MYQSKFLVEITHTLSIFTHLYLIAPFKSLISIVFPKICYSSLICNLLHGRSEYKGRTYIF